MFDEMTKKYVSGAIGSETQKAVENWGLKYASLHEGYAVLKEEVEEAGEEWDNINHTLIILWNKIKLNQDTKSNVEIIREHAEKLALEAVQVCAVCNKILKSI